MMNNKRTGGYPKYLTNAWRAMIDRCSKPTHSAYKNYGGRGIGVCERWLVFANFLADMGLRPAGMSLDRIDVNGNYEPSNCRWADAKQQTRNARSNRFLTIKGETKLMADWARQAGVSQGALYARVARKWDEDDLLRPPSPDHWTVRHATR